MNDYRMPWDTGPYCKTLTHYAKIMGVSWHEAERQLMPVRARKRKLKVQERLELEATCVVKTKKRKSR
jgi:hypothetical protein